MAEILVGDTAKHSCSNCGDAGAAAAAAAGGGGFLGASDADGAAYLFRWWQGIGVLSTVLLLQAILGMVQETTKDKYGKHPIEGLFYFHAFSLPAFAYYFYTAPDMRVSAAKWTASPALSVILRESEATESAFVSGALALLSRAPLLDVPVMWAHAATNIATQYICLTGVYSLISQTDQLTVNVVLTLRKFISLMLSIWIFNNTFTRYHWVGALLVLGGSLVYAKLPSAPPATAAPQSTNTVASVEKAEKRN